MNGTNRATLLVVDDAVENLQLLVGLLGGTYRVKVAKSGDKALEIVAKAPPDLILLDIVMPEMDGYEVCRRLRASPETAALPVVFVSGNDEPAEHERCTRAGAVALLRKPINAEDVLRTVEAILATGTAP